MPPHYRLELRFKHHARAFQKSFYPGAEFRAPDTITFQTDDFFEIARLFCFVN
ncbi:MAG: M55 family metallopeptidase [Pseudomonadota bacterium]